MSEEILKDSVTIVVMTNYSDGPSENLYTGESWKDAMDAICKSYATNFVVQQWIDGKMVEE